VLDRIEFWFMMVQLIFAGAFGACVGSLVNVLVYRLPLGLSVVTPPSRCPSCQTLLTWRENIPIFGWLLLRGRCRFCKTSISPEYPIVEASVALLFVVVYFFWYCVPFPWVWPPGSSAVFLGINWAHVKPEWASDGFSASWPVFVVLMVLLGSLAAVLLVDAKTYTIPLQLVWFPSVVAVLGHVGWAAWMSWSGRVLDHAPGWTWAIPSPGASGWGAVGAASGGMLGIAIGNILLSKGLIRRSFADYEAWEAEARAKAGAASPAAEGNAPSSDALAATTAGTSPADIWIEYPHARREMFKELVFLAPAIGLAFVGSWVAIRLAGPWTPGVTPISTGTPAHAVPLWLDVLAGVLLGYLIGGGAVWAVRILGSLLFGREAMGLGDVHLMAAVGACLGWIDSTLAFFGAAFVGLLWWALGLIFRGVSARAMPYGPFLAVSTLLVIFLKHPLERFFDLIAPAWAPWNLP
jgi:leader peptidase (prepilin peptidase)/N-methyltransferase